MWFKTMRSAGVISFRSGSIAASSNRDYRSMYPFNESAKQIYLLIQSTHNSYVFPLRNIRLAYLRRHEQVLCVSRD